MNIYTCRFRTNCTICEYTFTLFSIAQRYIHNYIYVQFFLSIMACSRRDLIKDYSRHLSNDLIVIVVTFVYSRVWGAFLHNMYVYVYNI